MDTKANLKSIAEEFDAVKNRVRNLIGDVHWPSDGAAKESILRDVLRRHLPATVGVGTGFAVDSNKCSGQIDVLLYDTSKPVLYRDGDFICITPDAVRGVIEVKTKIRSRTELRPALGQLRDNIRFFRGRQPLQAFAGLFVFDFALTQRSKFIEDFQSSAVGRAHNVVNFAALGPDVFVRFWSRDPTHHDQPPGHQYNRWHSYDLNRLAQGYFISNVVGFIASQSVRGNRSLWYLQEGKETNLLSTIQLESDNK